MAEQQPGKAAKSLQELYEQVRDRACRVADVRVQQVAPDGADGGPAPASAARPLRLRRDILDRELDRVYEARTLREVHEALERSVEVLRQLEVFDSIDALIAADPQDEPDACSVLLQLQEAGRYKLGGGTYTQGGEYSLEGHAVARNYLGLADQWSLTGEVGTRSSRNFVASFRLPRAGGRAFTPEVRLFQAINSQQLHSSWAEALRGVSVGVSGADNPGLSFAYEYGWRNLAAGSAGSRPVKAQAGDFLKASLRGSAIFEGGGWSSATVLPTQGWQLRLTGELGGLAPGTGSLRYLRQQAHLSWAAELVDGVSLHLQAGAGLLLPCWGSPGLGVGTKATPLPERFYLGGVESNLRGFDTRGVGPSEARRAPQRRSSGEQLAAAGGEPITRDALGGDLFANLYAALMLRLPGTAGDLNLHAQLFANGGSAVLLGPGSSGAAAGSGSGAASLGQRLWAGAAQLGSSFRWSTGFGLVLPTQLGRFEANWAWVLTSQEHDRIKRGFSFGFAANLPC